MPPVLGPPHGTPTSLCSQVRVNSISKTIADLTSRMPMRPARKPGRGGDSRSIARSFGRWYVLLLGPAQSRVLAPLARLDSEPAIEEAEA